MFFGSCFVKHPPPGQAGKEAYLWGVNNDMLDFANLDANGNPTILRSGLNMDSMSNAVTLSNADGELILYGGSDKLFGSDYSLLAEGFKVTTTLAQPALVLPMPGQDGVYVYITCLKVGDPGTYSSVIEPGAAVPVRDKNTRISNKTAVAVTAVVTPDRSGYFIVTKLAQTETDLFEVFRLDQSGLTRVAATVPPGDSTQIWPMYSNFKFSADGNLLCYAFTNAVDKGFVALHAFDPDTLTITHIRNIQVTPDAVSAMGGVEFSADNKFIYTGHRTATGGHKVYQIVTATGVSTEIGTGGGAVAGFQLAPNGSIYSCVSNTYHMGRITNPDKAYTGDANGCLYSQERILTDMARPGLPVFVASFLRLVPVELAPGTSAGQVRVTLTGKGLPPGAAVTAYGVCWGSDPDPVPGADNFLDAPDGAGDSFTADLAARLALGSYKLRAYAEVDGRTYYGDTMDITITDTTVPAVSGSSVTNGETDVAVDAVLTVTFNEALDPATVDGISVSLAGPGGAAVNGTVSYDGTAHQVGFTPSADLEYATSYTLTLTTDLTDAAGNAMASAAVIGFTTADEPYVPTPPVVTGTIPVNSAADVPVDASLRVTFNTAMDASSFNNLSVMLKAGTVALDAAMNYEEATRTLVVTPSADLDYHTAYTLTITGVADADGDLLAEPYTLTFTTEDEEQIATPPLVIGTNVRDGETGVTINIVLGLVFDSDMKADTFDNRTVVLRSARGAVDCSLYYESSRKTLVAAPLVPLDYHTAYTLTMTGVADADGDLLAEPFTLSFTTDTGFVDEDGDGVSDSEEEFPGDSSRVTVTATTNTGQIVIDASGIGGAALSEVRTVSDYDPSLGAPERPAGVFFPDGLLAYKLTNLTPGQTVELPITFPTVVPGYLRVFKVAGGAYAEITSRVRVDGHTLWVTLTDGDEYDLDGEANGEIVDPVGAALSDTVVPADGSGSGGPTGNGIGGCFVDTLL